MNKKTVFLAFLALLCVGNIFAANNATLTLNITGVAVNEGKIYVRLYSNEKDYKKDVPHTTFSLESASKSITHSFSIPKGEYLIAIFQDTNKNRMLDTNLIGLPTEPVGLSNYNGGIPGGFNKHKIQINAGTNKIAINLGKI